MAYAVTHIITAIILIDIYRHYVAKKKNFPRYLVLVGGIAGLLPDIDIVIGWALSFISGHNINIHGGFTHSLLFPMLFFIIGFAFQLAKKPEVSKIFYVISFGTLLHLGLDCGFGEIKSYLWPLANFSNFCPKLFFYDQYEVVDAFLLMLWLIHEEIAHKIKDYF